MQVAMDMTGLVAAEATEKSIIKVKGMSKLDGFAAFGREGGNEAYSSSVTAGLAAVGRVGGRAAYSSSASSLEGLAASGRGGANVAYSSSTSSVAEACKS
jgi:hypothetical protein